MSEAVSLSKRTSQASSLLRGIRARGGVDVRLGLRSGVTRAIDVREVDGYKLRLPRVAGERLEAAVINTGGGVAGGDEVRLNVEALNRTCACIATPAAERIYRAADAAPAKIDVGLRLGTGAVLHWLPQETIVFDGARLKRTISVEMAGDAELLIAEMLVFGRAAMGEDLSSGAIRDRWSVRRDGQLVYADAVRLEDTISQSLNETAVTSGRRVVASVLFVSPRAEDRLGLLRSALTEHEAIAAASAWNGFLALRIIADRTEDVRAIIAVALGCLTGRHPPRVWSN